MSTFIWISDALFPSKTSRRRDKAAPDGSFSMTTNSKRLMLVCPLQMNNVVVLGNKFGNSVCSCAATLSGSSYLVDPLSTCFCRL